MAALRPAYRSELATGTDRFFASRRTVCPWCSSARLTIRLRTTDLLQHKPGRFVLDRCADCGHVFQNPQLTTEGLEFYYRDFYDGLGERRMSGAFGGRTAMYRARAETMLPYAPAPRTWLDVGTGHGHFCGTARAVLPGTVFDGLDFTDGVELAAREGRVDHAYRGAFPDLAPELTARYDVVSMFHYLEHSTDPDRELRAAHATVRPGGHLLIEVPDPESRYARLLGRWWLPWLQPQHLHFMPVANLRRRLTELGFTVIAEQHAAPHDPVDLLAAVWLFLDHTAPREDAPWLAEPPGAFRRVLRTVLLLAGIPALVTATLLDRIAVRPLSHRLRLSNAYRLVARRD
ncbi:class I SAM-dependent methyltransferase [Streptomyces pluripotens]|uniref:Class I SAM-dependent methyltransferase n=1 Tax=Streptomyces pluripotens TaxID=1355015 RepID=A0A221P7J5_9ACTN|nr:methyltransferase type 12 [Streptomyces pluripotens]ASN28180.1 class I SAM-dependent methyltransferase [Streptomyces pluripotens]KIE25691.1 methyltransferase type 12 [Streptomyces sp. MUSC 125]